MNTHPGFETAGSYLHAHFGQTGLPLVANRPEGPFVTVSRESGAGGTSLARALALRLDAVSSTSDWTVFTGNLIDEMLQAHDLSPSLARFLPEDRVSEISAAVGELVGLHPNLWDLVQKTNEFMCHLARNSHAIFVGRGANFATRGIEHGVHVRLVASPAHRAQNTAHQQSMTEAASYAYNAKQDLARERYVRTHFNADINDPTAYDLVIDTSRVHPDEAADLVTALVKTRTPELAA